MTKMQFHRIMNRTWKHFVGFFIDFKFDREKIVIFTLALATVFFGITTLHYAHKAKFWRTTPEIKTVVRVMNVTKVVVRPTYSRTEVAEAIAKYQSDGKFDKIVKFYSSTYTKDLNLTYLIIGASIVYKIPTNLLFALISAESDFDPKAVNHNTNGSTDRGLMQLNSRYFKGIRAFDANVNLQYGCKHLRKYYDRYGTWEQAVTMYNGFSRKSTGYQAKVLEKERQINRAFTVAINK